MKLVVISASVLSAVADFGLTTNRDSGNNVLSYTVDTGADLVFTIRAAEPSSHTQSAGDIMSMRFRGVEYQDQRRGSQLNSGFDWLFSGFSGVAVSARQMGDDHIKVSVIINDGARNLVHYYLAKRGEAKIFMGTVFNAEPDTLGMVRYIVRVPIGVLPRGTPQGTPGGAVPGRSPVTWPDDLRGTSGAIEAHDVYGITSGTYAGETRSKHYSNMRAKEWHHIGGTGDGVGLWMVRDNYEGGSGGPFYRCLLNQITDTNNEITYIVNYGEGQTEAFRLQRFNGYTLVFNSGEEPSAPDTRWFHEMQLLGFTDPSDRGSMSLVGVNGMADGVAYVLHAHNENAQYWADVNGQGYATRINGMIPGSYAVTVYKGELAVASSSVDVRANQVAIHHTVTVGPDAPRANGKWHLAAGDPSFVEGIFRIGVWDGSPQEFLNGDKITTMHPSDVRMASWKTGEFVVGQSWYGTDFPAYHWKGTDSEPNPPLTIRFSVSQAQLEVAGKHVLRVGVTTAQSNARPKVVVNGAELPFVGSNSGDSWPPSQPKTRTMTVGSYRGVNVVYDFPTDTSLLHHGSNTVEIYALSGSSSSSFWLSPGFAIDAIDLVPVASAVVV